GCVPVNQCAVERRIQREDVRALVDCNGDSRRALVIPVSSTNVGSPVFFASTVGMCWGLRSGRTSTLQANYEGPHAFEAPIDSSRWEPTSSGQQGESCIRNGVFWPPQFVTCWPCSAQFPLYQVTFWAIYRPSDQHRRHRPETNLRSFRPTNLTLWSHPLLFIRTRCWLRHSQHVPTHSKSSSSSSG